MQDLCVFSSVPSELLLRLLCMCDTDGLYEIYKADEMRDVIEKMIKDSVFWKCRTEAAFVCKIDLVVQLNWKKVYYSLTTITSDLWLSSFLDDGCLEELMVVVKHIFPCYIEQDTLVKWLSSIVNSTVSINGPSRAKALTILLSCGQHINTKTAVWLAASNGNLEIMLILLAYSNTYLSSQNYRAISDAYEHGHLDMVRLLLEDPRTDHTNSNIATIAKCVDEIDSSELAKCIYVEATRAAYQSSRPKSTPTLSFYI